MDNETVADRMRRLTTEARAQKEAAKVEMSAEEIEALNDKKQTADFTVFLDYIKKDALDKIEKRATIGATSANILEYSFQEYFMVTKNDNQIVRIPTFASRPAGAYIHSIFKTVVKTDKFRQMLSEYVTSLGDMRFKCWSPKKNVCVIEVYWAETKVHKWADAE